MELSYPHARLIDFLNSESVMPGDLDAQKTLQNCADSWIEYLRHRALIKRTAPKNDNYQEWEYQASGRLFGKLKRSLSEVMDHCSIKFDPFSLKVSLANGRLIKTHAIHPEMPFLILPEYGYQAVRFIQLIAEPIGIQLTKCVYCGHFAIGKNLSSGPQRFCPKPAGCAKNYDNEINGKGRMRVYRQRQGTNEKAGLDEARSKELACYAAAASDFGNATLRKKMWKLWFADWNREQGKRFGRFLTPEEFELAAMNAKNQCSPGVL